MSTLVWKEYQVPISLQHKYSGPTLACMLKSFIYTDGRQCQCHKDIINRFIVTEKG